MRPERKFPKKNPHCGSNIDGRHSKIKLRVTKSEANFQESVKRVQGWVTSVEYQDKGSVACHRNFSES